MEFKGQYLSYDEYLGLGGTLEETPFNLLEFKYRKEIDKYTFGRLENVGNNYNEVKLCVYNLIEELNAADNNYNSNISNESTDGYSVSYYQENTEVLKTRNNKIQNVIYNCLSTLKINNIPVLYRGTDDN